MSFDSDTDFAYREGVEQGEKDGAQIVLDALGHWLAGRTTVPVEELEAWRQLLLLTLTKREGKR